MEKKKNKYYEGFKEIFFILLGGSFMISNCVIRLMIIYTIMRFLIYINHTPILTDVIVLFMFLWTFEPYYNRYIKRWTKWH